MAKINSWGSDDPAEVAKGGSGRGSQIAYSVLCGGTTTTAAQQSVASVGSSGQILTSTGAGSLPSFQNNAGGAGDDWTLITTVDTSSGGTKTVTSGLGTAYEDYRISLNAVGLASNGATLTIDFSDDGGSTYTIEIQGYTNSSSSSTGVVAQSLLSADRLVGYVHISGNKKAFNKDLISVIANSAGATTVSNSLPSNGSMLTLLDIDGIQFSTDTGDFDEGSITIYGR